MLCMTASVGSSCTHLPTEVSADRNEMSIRWSVILDNSWRLSEDFLDSNSIVVNTYHLQGISYLL